MASELAIKPDLEKLIRLAKEVGGWEVRVSARKAAESSDAAKLQTMRAFRKLHREMARDALGLPPDEKW